MSVLIEDVVNNLGPTDKDLYDREDLSELLYADDTLIIGTNGDSISRYLAAISQAGALYGMELHLGKFQLLRVRCEDKVHRPDGTEIEATGSTFTIKISHPLILSYRNRLPFQSYI